MDNLLSKESRGVSGVGSANGIGIGREVWMRAVLTEAAVRLCSPRLASKAAGTDIGRGINRTQDPTLSSARTTDAGPEKLPDIDAGRPHLVQLSEERRAAAGFLKPYRNPV